MLDNKVDAVSQTEMTIVVTDLVRHATIWFLRNALRPMDISHVVGAYAPGIAAMAGGLGDSLADLEAAALRDRASRLAGKGVPDSLARRIAGLPTMRSVCHIVHAATGSGRPIDEIGRAYFAIGDRLGLDWLRSAAERIESRDRWERVAVDAIVEDLYGQQRALVEQVMERAGGLLDRRAVADWVDANGATAAKISALVDEFRLGGYVDLARLEIVNRHLRSMWTPPGVASAAGRALA